MPATTLQKKRARPATTTRDELIALMEKALRQLDYIQAEAARVAVEQERRR